MVLLARYTRPAMALHWLVAALVAANVVLGLRAELFAEDWIQPAINLHKSIGITVLGLALLRVLWRLTHPPPPSPHGRGGLERRLARAAHLALYGLILALPLSGWVHDSALVFAARRPLQLFGLLPWPRIGVIQAMPADARLHLLAQSFAVHAALADVLYAVCALHIAGALRHRLRERGALRRMWS